MCTEHGLTLRWCQPMACGIDFRAAMRAAFDGSEFQKTSCPDFSSGFCAAVLCSGFVQRFCAAVSCSGCAAVSCGERPERPAQHSPGQAKRHPGLSHPPSVCALKGQHNGYVCAAICPKYTLCCPFRAHVHYLHSNPGCRFACPGLCCAGLSGRSPRYTTLQFGQIVFFEYFYVRNTLRVSSVPWKLPGRSR